MRSFLLLVLAAGTAAAQPWELKLPERIELAPGATSTLPLSIAVEHGQTVSKDAGLVLDIAPDAGVTVKRRRLGRADAIDPDEESPRFAIPIRADAAGDFSVKLHLRFWLCGTKVCKPIDARRTVVVTVAAAPAP